MGTSDYVPQGHTQGPQGAQDPQEVKADTNEPSLVTRNGPMTYTEYKAMKADKAKKPKQNDDKMNDESNCWLIIKTEEVHRKNWS